MKKGNELEEALLLNNDYKDEISLEELELDVQRLEAQLIKKQSMLEKSIIHRDYLQSNSTNDRTKLKECNRLLKSKSNKFSSMKQEIMNKNDQIISSINEIQQSIDHILDIYQNNSASNSCSATFLSSSQIKEFLNQEDIFFKQIISHLSSDQIQDVLNNSEMQILSPVIQNLEATYYEDNREELERLQHAFSISENERINAEIQSVRSKAELETLKSQVYKENEAMDESLLKQKIDDMENTLTQLKRSFTNNTKVLIPDIQSNISKLLSTPILLADYNSKYLRLQYKQSKYNTIISYLLSQLSRFQFLSNLLDEESKDHREIYGLIKSFRNELQIHKDLLHNRLIKNDEVKENILDKEEKITSDILSNLFKLISLYENKEMEDITFKEVKSFINELKLKSDHCEDQLMLSNQNDKDELQNIFHNFNLIKKLLYSEASTKTPHIRSPKLKEHFDKVESLLEDLSSEMEDVIKDYNMKLESLEGMTREKKIERKLYILFYNHPENLLSKLNKLKNIVNSRQVNKIAA